MLKVLESEAVFVTFDEDVMVVVDVKMHQGRDAGCQGSGLVDVFGALKELENETRIACVKIPRWTVKSERMVVSI